MSANRTLLEGELAEPVVVRALPSGLPVARLELEHQGPASGLGPLEELRVLITVTASGSLAERCRKLPVGTRLRVEGSLNRVRRLKGEEVRWGRMELAARRIEFPAGESDG